MDHCRLRDLCFVSLNGCTLPGVDREMRCDAVGNGWMVVLAAEREEAEEEWIAI